MAISEYDRHRLYRRLEELLGEDEASTLMEHLPPVGWADVATKGDLEHLAAVMGARVDVKIERLRSELYKGFRTQTTLLVATNLTLFGVAATVLR